MGSIRGEKGEMRGDKTKGKVGKRKGGAHRNLKKYEEEGSRDEQRVRRVKRRTTYYRNKGTENKERK